MPLVAILKNSFVSGELSPQMRALTDLKRYANGAKQLENWRILPTGGVINRAGLRYVATAAGFNVLLPFEPSTSDAYILECSNTVIRFYKDTASLGVSISTPYVTADLRQLRTAQVNDVMLLAHSSYAPRRLVRTAPTTFVLSPVPFYPPPTYESGDKPAIGLTLSATSGTITITAASAYWQDGDIQRQIVAGVGRAIITGVTSSTVLSALVIDPFISTTVASGTWTLTGSPVGQLTPSASGPVGAQVTVDLGGEHPWLSNLVNQTFSGWTDYSGAVQLITGVHTGASNTTDKVIDVNVDFVKAGVLPTHIVNNIGDASFGEVSSVTTKMLGISGLLFGGTENDFDNGEGYKILETGASRTSPTQIELNGGTAGHGWRETSFSTSAGVAYQIKFTIGESQASIMVGSAAALGELYVETGFPPGEHSIVFTATGTTTFLSFRNNQNAWASISHISCRQYSLSAFRSGDALKYVRLHGGLIQLRTLVQTWQMSGEIVKELDTKAPAAAGGWSLETPSWSDALGWPRTVVLYEGRLYFAGSASFPQTIWGSGVDSFFDFFVGTNPDDGVEFAVVDSGGNITLNVIASLVPAENMLANTSHGEYRLIGSGDDPISAVTPPRARIQSSYGSDAVVQPIKVDQSIIFAQRKGSKVRQMTLDATTTAKFLAEDLTIVANHLLKEFRLLELAYQPEPLSTVWGTRSDGTALALCYDAREEVKGWWRMVTAGAIESVAIIPHPTQNRHQVWMSINRATGRFIEVMDEEAVMSYAGGSWRGLTVDAGVVYSGAATATITGLSHLNGQPVDIVGNGVQYPTQVVSGGQITGLSPLVTSAFVGLHYDSRGTTLPPEVGALGTIQRSHKHWIEVTALLDETVRLTVQGQALELTGLAPYTGEKHIPTLGWGRDGTITFVRDQPYPATLLGLVGYLDVEAEQG